MFPFMVREPREFEMVSDVKVDIVPFPRLNVRFPALVISTGSAVVCVTVKVFVDVLTVIPPVPAVRNMPKPLPNRVALDVVILPPALSVRLFSPPT